MRTSAAKARSHFGAVNDSGTPACIMRCQRVGRYWAIACPITMRRPVRDKTAAIALCWAWRALEERKDAIAPSVAANSAESKLSAASGKSALSDSEPALPVMARMAALKARVRRATSQANSAAAPTLPNRMASFDKRVT